MEESLRKLDMSSVRQDMKHCVVGSEWWVSPGGSGEWRGNGQLEKQKWKMGRGTPIRLTAALVERGESGGKPPPSKMPG